MRRFLLFGVFLMAVICAWAQNTAVANGKTWTYETDATNGGIMITGCTPITGNLTIPDQLDGQNVVSIKDNAFLNKTGFTGTLTIPSTVKQIGYGAFSGCSGLKGDLVIPNSVTTIGAYAFNNCSGFTGNLTISNLVEKIENGTFFGCSRLTGRLTIPSLVKSIGRNAFSACSGLSGDLRIPDLVNSIGDGAFSSCRGFTGSLTIPSLVNSIGFDAFNGCSGLTGHLTIPSSVKTIGGYAFYDCMNITSISIGGGVQGIWSYAFGGSLLTSLQKVVFESNTVLKSLDLNIFGAGTIKDNLCAIDASGLTALTTVTGEMPNYGLVYLPANGVALNFTTATYTDGVSPDNVVLGSTCETLVLNDDFAYGTSNTTGPYMDKMLIKSFTANKVYYKGKTLPTGVNDCYTTYLPFEMTIPAGMEVYKLSSRSGSTLIFSKEANSTMSAYTPYLIRRESTSTGALTFDNIEMTNQNVALAPELYTVTNGSTADGWKFFGTTSPISNADAANNRLYVLDANNTWKPVLNTQTSGYVHSFRAFLQAPVGYTGAAPVAFVLDDDTTTGLDRVQADREERS